MERRFGFGAACCTIAIAALLAAPGSSAQAHNGWNLMPWPANVQPGQGNLHIDSTFTVGLTGYREPRLDRAVQRFLGQLQRQTALVLLNKPPEP